MEDTWKGVGVGLRQVFVGDSGDAFVLGGGQLRYIPADRSVQHDLKIEGEFGETVHFVCPRDTGSLREGEGWFTFWEDTLTFEGDQYTPGTIPNIKDLPIIPFHSVEKSPTE